MSEYIKREDALSAICTGISADYRQIKAIDAIPAADVAPVVRCKDCVKKKMATELCWTCPCGVGYYNDPEFYCAYGKER